MRKIFTLALGLVCFGMVSADSLQTFNCGIGIPGRQEPALLGLGISPNGKYICGPIENAMGYFVASVETGEVKWTVPEEADEGELRHVDNNGLAIGFDTTAITYDFATGDVSTLYCPDDVKYVLAEALSADGSVKVGSFVGTGFETQAVVAVDGTDDWKLLPMPTEEDLAGTLQEGIKGSSAKYVSADGKIILGCLGSFAAPVLWRLNEAGEYEMDLFIKRFVKLSEGQQGDDSYPLWSVSGMYLNLSPNGRYASMLGLIKDEEGTSIGVPAIYDTVEDKMIIYDEPQEINIMGAENFPLYPTAIADNGTFIGSIGQPVVGTIGSFIMRAGKTQAENFLTAFPSYQEMLAASDGNNVPTGISADASLILGYTFYSADFTTSEEEDPAYYLTYVIHDDYKYPDTAVEEISADVTEATIEGIYTLDGRRSGNLVKGVNILRMSDGTTRKILRK